MWFSFSDAKGKQTDVKTYIFLFIYLILKEIWWNVPLMTPFANT